MFLCVKLFHLSVASTIGVDDSLLRASNRPSNTVCPDRRRSRSSRRHTRPPGGAGAVAAAKAAETPTTAGSVQASRESESAAGSVVVNARAEPKTVATSPPSSNFSRCAARKQTSVRKNNANTNTQTGFERNGQSPQDLQCTQEPKKNQNTAQYHKTC